MKITAENGQGYKIFDVECKAIPYVYSYDTDTKEVALYIPRIGLGGTVTEKVGKFNMPKLVKFILEGSYAIDPEGNKVESSNLS